MIKEQTPRELLSKFYADNRLGADGGQSSSHVKIDISDNLHFYFPNFDARRRAVIKHDIHHLVTGYEATLLGESEISAWEIASGCRSYWAAFLINTSGLILGIPLNFKRVVKAFARGRRTKNLYHEMPLTKDALDIELGQLQSILLLDKYSANVELTYKDYLLFFAFALHGALYSIFITIFLPVILFYTLYILLLKKQS